MQPEMSEKQPLSFPNLISIFNTPQNLLNVSETQRAERLRGEGRRTDRPGKR